MTDFSQRQPNTSYNSQYPYNQSYVTESGHFLEWDNTPGHTRIRMGHKSGTYHEIQENGSKVEVTVNDHSTYIKGGLTFTVDKNHDIKVGGHGRLIFGKDMHMEVGGNGAINFTGSGSVTVSGSYSIISKGNVTVIAMGDAKVKVGGSANVVVGGDVNATVTGNINASTGKNLNATVGQNLQAQVSGDTTVNTKGKATVSSDKEVLVQCDNVQLGGESQCQVITTCGPSPYVFAKV